MLGGQQELRVEERREGRLALAVRRARQHRGEARQWQRGGAAAVAVQRAAHVL